MDIGNISPLSGSLILSQFSTLNEHYDNQNYKHERKMTISPDPAEFRWYAAYTKSRSEKKAFEKLKGKGVEAYLPLRRSRHQWTDRLKWVEEPLIRSYIFIRTNESGYYDAINTPGLVCYVTFEGKAAPIPDRQIEMLKLLLKENAEMEISNERFEAGEKIIVISGTLVGMQGEMVEYRGKKKVLIRLGTTGTNILVTVNLDLIERD
jgi:transcriptional antiterminator RfaH